jgi:uncharacterized protein YndB with AHSA1/START domain
MWTYEHAVETSVPRAALWSRWSDVEAYPEWNAGITGIEADGPFAAGTSFTMTPPEGDPVRLTLTEVVTGVRFTDVMDAGDVVVTTVHLLEPVGADRTRVVYRTEITGPAADRIGPDLGPAITADFPAVLDALVEVAQA